MDTLIIYLSFYGNTGAIAERIENTLGKKAELRFFEDVKEKEIRSASLLIFGSPTHKYYSPSHMREFLDALPDSLFENKLFCVFDTRYNQPIAKLGSAALEISDRIKRRGGTELLPPESFFVVDREGPLEDGEEQRAEEWARKIQTALDEEYNN